jgi:hypothetical protein
VVTSKPANEANPEHAHLRFDSAKMFAGGPPDDLQVEDAK